MIRTGKNSNTVASMASPDGDFRKCAGCQREINIAAKELFLYRCEKFWHELCFRCKSCERPIPNCEYVAIVDDVWHESCYKREHHGSSLRTRNQTVRLPCTSMGKIFSSQGKRMGKLWQSCEKIVGQCRRRRDAGSEPCQDQARGTSLGNDTSNAEPEDQDSGTSLDNDTSNAASEDQARGTSLDNDTSDVVSKDDPFQPAIDKAQNGTTAPLVVTLKSPMINKVNSSSVIIPPSSANSLTNSTTFDNETLVSRELGPTYKAIREKYGDITKDCVLKARGFKSAYVTIMCKIVKTLQTTRADQISEDKLQEMFFSLRDIEKAGINVGWLEERVVRLRERMCKLAERKESSCTLEKAEVQQEIVKEMLRKSMKLKEEELGRLKGEYEKAEAEYEKIQNERTRVKSSMDVLSTLPDGLF